MITKEAIVDVIKASTRPLFAKEIAAELALEPGEMPVLEKQLEALEADGVLMTTSKEKYGRPSFFGFESGVVQVAQKGFGFLLVEDGEDIFIPRTHLNGAMNGDTVIVKVYSEDSNGRSRGFVERIVKRFKTEVVGVFEKTKNFGFVIVDDKKFHMDIFVGGGGTKGAETGDKVLVEIIKWPTDGKKPEGIVREIIGKAGDLRTERDAIIRKFDLPDAFPKKVLKASEQIPDTIPAEELEKRKDFRNHAIVTIDGKDAKDLDDAIGIARRDDGHYDLSVHIADVSHYVTENSILDREALERATSVYLVDQVIPMLPERLSNGMCSLNPNVDRLVMSLEMVVTPQGKVKSYELSKGVINTVMRLNYEEVADLIEGKASPEDVKRLEPVRASLEQMAELSQILNKMREQRGSIDFDFTESYIDTDEEGYPVVIRKRERRISHRLIEEFMLLANETVAEHMFAKELPFLYRIHEVPSPDKIAEFRAFIHNFGYQLEGDPNELKPIEVQNLLSKVEGTPEEHVINRMMLRSLKQARYSPENEGHFGLAAEHYTHFTSPIRRYPDLQIHRILSEQLKGDLNQKRVEHFERILPEVAQITSAKERVAESCERETDDFMKAVYMLDYVGEEFEGIVSSILPFGMFVALDNTVEGLVGNLSMQDFEYNELSMTLQSKSTKAEIHPGDHVTVRVTKVNPLLREIDFELLGHENLTTS